MFDFLKKKEGKKIPLTELGTTGTELLSGMITEDYNSDLQFPQSIEIFDEMRKSDATVGAVLKAIKYPLISAKWQIQAGGEEKKDIDIADFITKNLFEKVRFKQFLREALGFLDFGFYYFEKNFEIVDGMVEWKNFAPRLPKAHYLWEIKGKSWIDGHPAGITQQVNSNDESTQLNYNEIPWNKLILFSCDKEGNNYEGVSVLRSAYKHWFYKDLMYKIQSISSERYGVGFPIAKTDNLPMQGQKNKLLELVKNIRSNEKSYGVIGNDESIEILTPTGTGVGTQVKDSIEHHDKKIYDAILAGFLNLTSGEGGSNALSKDQSSFFLRGLQGIADIIIDNLNDHIKELVDLNFNNVENYPQLTVSDIGTISMDEQIEAIIKLNTAGLLDITVDDRQALRGIVKLPKLTNKQIEELKKEREEQEKQEPIIEEKKGEKAEIKEDIKKEDKKMTELSELKKKEPSKREKAFSKNITQFEKYLERKYKEAENITKRYEKEFQKTLEDIYKEADSERLDGVVVLKYNKAKVKAGEKKIDKIAKKLEKELINSGLQTEIFEEAESKVIETLEQNNKLLGESFHVNRGRFDSFIEGYVSNMQGVIYNESRRMKENIVLHFGSQASVDLAVETAKKTTFNKNILRLSFVTHPRAAFKNSLYEQSIKEGFTLFKTLVPTNKIDNVLQRPTGKTFSILYTILTVAMINQLANKDTQGKTAEAVSGLGLHHGSFEYYYPIESIKQTEEEEIAKEQRLKLEEEALRINNL